MNHRLYSIIVVGLLIFSGCPLLSQNGGIVTYTGGIEISDDGFVMEGDIDNIGKGDVPRFSNVSVSLYASNGSKLSTHEVGALEREIYVSIRSEEIPELIIIYSPEFWETNIEVDYLRLDDADNVYAKHTVSSRDELPVQPTP